MTRAGKRPAPAEDRAAGMGAAGAEGAATARGFRPVRAPRWNRVLLAAIAGAGLLGCVRATPYVAEVLTRAPEADSATVALWAMDEPSGDRVADSGRHGLSGTAGIDTRADFGRFRGARLFTHSIESFVYVPYAPVMETGPELGIEAWVFVDAYSLHEISMLISRWSQQANEQSWILGLVGQQPRLLIASGASPGTFRPLVELGATGHLVFAFQPDDASTALSYFSSEPVPLGRWTHVAVGFNGEVVRFYLNGRLDAQYAAHDRIRRSPAAILIGNDLDPDLLTDFGGRLGVAPGFDTTPYYDFQGRIDELRLSRIARTEFVGLPPEKEK